MGLKLRLSGQDKSLELGFKSKTIILELRADLCIRFRGAAVILSALRHEVRAWNVESRGVFWIEGLNGTWARCFAGFPQPEAIANLSATSNPVDFLTFLVPWIQFQVSASRRGSITRSSRLL